MSVTMITTESVDVSDQLGETAGFVAAGCIVSHQTDGNAQSGGHGIGVG